MTPFIISALLITLITLIILIRPLRKTRSTVSYERQAQNIHYAKERLSELEEQLHNASISATDYEALKLEIESTLAHDIDIANNGLNQSNAEQMRSNKGVIGILCALLPLVALGFYLSTGTPEALMIAQKNKEMPSNEQIAAMLESIEERLVQNPTDAQGWTVLSRTYLSMGRYADAKRGFLRLLELQGESAELYVSLAEASTSLARGDMSGEPSLYTQKALKLDPQNPQALWLAGVSAAQKNNFTQARIHWNTLLPLLDGVPQQQQELREIIKQTQEQAPSLALPDNKLELSVRVELADNMSSTVNPSDAVFVFAKAQKGPPAPLAVKRLTVADLPITLTLSDADAMMAQLRLSLFEDVVISARVARSGNPVAQKGDIQSASVVSKNNNSDEIKLVITTLVE